MECRPTRAIMWQPVKTNHEQIVLHLFELTFKIILPGVVNPKSSHLSMKSLTGYNCRRSSLLQFKKLLDAFIHNVTENRITSLATHRLTCYKHMMERLLYQDWFQIYLPYLINYNIVLFNNGLCTFTEVVFKCIHYSMKKLTDKQWRNCKAKFRELNRN